MVWSKKAKTLYIHVCREGEAVGNEENSVDTNGFRRAVAKTIQLLGYCGSIKQKFYRYNVTYTASCILYFYIVNFTSILKYRAVVSAYPREKCLDLIKLFFIVPYFENSLNICILFEP